MTHNTKNIKTVDNAEGGFTLIELSIVLVIIGLIVGSVLVGQDLIRAAENRAIITQLERYNTAVNTFRLKYNGIPGDLSNATNMISGVVSSSNGDGNAVIYSSTGTPASLTSGYTLASEVVFFWNHLSQAGMVDGAFSGVTTNGTVLSNTNSSFQSNFPSTKANRGGIFAYGGTDGLNYFYVGLQENTSGGTAIGTANILTADDAYTIDSKIDDGKPNGGSVQAQSTFGTAATVASGCITATGSTGSYNVAGTGYDCQFYSKMN